MALTWTAKAPDAVLKYEWKPKPETALESVSAIVTSGTVTVDAEVNGDTAVFTVTGGSDGVVQVLAVTAQADGETFSDAVYLPIEGATNRLTTTASDIASFALRKIIGFGESADGAELQDALEWLNDMLAEWKAQGADIGAVLPLAASDTLMVNDAVISAVKNNLLLRVADNYGRELSPVTVETARRGLQVVKVMNLPDTRAYADSF